MEPNESGELSEKVVMISGASRGLGAALARRFHEEGARVSLCARSGDDLARLCGELGGADRCLPVPADVANPADVARWAEATASRFGRVDALVNNASLLGPRVPVEDYPPDEWRRVIDVNLTGSYLCVRAALPHLLEGGGSITNVSSGVGDHGRPRWGAYTVSKNGLEALSEVLAGELEDQVSGSTPSIPGPCGRGCGRPPTRRRTRRPFPDPTR